MFVEQFVFVARDAHRRTRTAQREMLQDGRVYTIERLREFFLGHDLVAVPIDARKIQ